mmetsp:Transcript_1121/g.2577  ORF Transcript_1121/g.2577 Transcript_1121/m.2577 type:complete len:244 (+) Transcript_1121:213-944(+)
MSAAGEYASRPGNSIPESGSLSLYKPTSMYREPERNSTASTVDLTDDENEQVVPPAYPSRPRQRSLATNQPSTTPGATMKKLQKMKLTTNRRASFSDLVDGWEKDKLRIPEDRPREEEPRDENNKKIDVRFSRRSSAPPDQLAGRHPYSRRNSIHGLHGPSGRDSSPEYRSKRERRGSITGVMHRRGRRATNGMDIKKKDVQSLKEVAKKGYQRRLSMPGLPQDRHQIPKAQSSSRRATVDQM